MRAAWALVTVTLAGCSGYYDFVRPADGDAGDDATDAELDGGSDASLGGRDAGVSRDAATSDAASDAGDAGVVDACVPLTCGDLYDAGLCGAGHDDGCGARVACGSDCSSGNGCSNVGVCGALPTCTRETDGGFGDSCGLVSNDYGSTECGGCDSTTHCAADNVCRF